MTGNAYQERVAVEGMEQHLLKGPGRYGISRIHLQAMLIYPPQATWFAFHIVLLGIFQMGVMKKVTAEGHRHWERLQLYRPGGGERERGGERESGSR